MIFSLAIGFLHLRWIDAIDILLVSYLMYQIYKLIKGSVALKIFIGIISIYVIFQIVNSLGMEMLSGILGQFVGVGGLAALILFQQEIRKILLLIGKSSFIGEEGWIRNMFSAAGNRENLTLQPILDAAKVLSKSHSGALIVFARSTELKFYAETGQPLDAVLSKSLLETIFVKTSPLHDGAVIIAKGRIKAARCILPVSENQDLPPNFGLRHRSALGLSELTDAVVLVVSEETGQISIAHDGLLEHNLNSLDMKERLSSLLLKEKSQPMDEIEASEMLLPTQNLA